MAYLNKITGIKRCGQKDCAETDSTKFGKCKTYPDGLAFYCLVCAKAKARAYDKEHRKERNEQLKAWVRAHPERKRKPRSKEKRAADSRKWLEKPENRIKRRGYIDAWITNNPERKKAQTHRRRALKENLPSLWTNEMWTECKAAFAGCCAYCGQLKEVIEKDHFVPISASWLPEGPERPGHVPWNIVPACTSCNRGKVHKEPVKWLTQTGRIDRLPAILEHLRAMRRKYDLP
jgi:5-methylcytosine-specific restriction endonuclease McrA